MTADVIDLYAGPGGWDEGMRTIGITDVVGLEYEPNACATARAAGHHREQVDIGNTPTAPYVGARGLLISPPCQAWSMAGNRQGDPRIAAPGHRDREGGERQHEQSIRVSVQEAAVLQSFPPDYPWQGTKTAQYLQVGNAIPPRLAAHIVAAATGLGVPDA